VQTNVSWVRNACLVHMASKRMVWRAALAIFFISLLTQPLMGQVTVFAAASLMDSLKELAQQYEKAGHGRVVFNFAGSSTLARQIEEGAPADIFFSADEAQMDRVEKKDLLLKGTRRDRLSNTLAIVVASHEGPNLRGPADLASSVVHRLALGDPSSVPIGVYAKQFLEAQGLWASVSAKVVPTENVRAALAAVEAGNAEASIVYRTDALLSRRVRIAFQVPRDLGPNIRYPVAGLRGARNLEETRRFLDFLDGPEAGRIFEKQGFLVLP
jgi:molybdate transport system substrate-binding protein